MRLEPLGDLIDKSNWNSMAYIEANRIRRLAAFNLNYNPKRKVLNQHCVMYTFMDKSILKIYKTKRAYLVINPLGVQQMTGALFNY